MPVSKAQQKARDKYLEKFEEIRARVPKGRKDEIKRYAESCGESVNTFISRAISEAMQRDTAQQDDILARAILAHIERTGEAEAAFIRRAVGLTIMNDNISLEKGIHPATGEKMKEDKTNE